jgi:hypothetical protein
MELVVRVPSAHAPEPRIDPKVADQQRDVEVSGLNLPQSVTLLSRGVRLGAELLALLGEERQLNLISSPVELAKGGPPADVIVVDVPAQDRRVACEQVRRHHRGRLIVLLDQGDSGHDLPSDHNRTLLTRPFQLHELSVALAGSAPSQPTSHRPGGLRLVLPHLAHARTTASSFGTGRSVVAQVVPRLVRSWEERRRVWVSAISIMAALAFVGAFALASQGDQCGPTCEELTGADLTAPSSTTVTVVGPDTTASGAGMVGPTTTDPSVVPTTDGGSRVDTATSRTTQIATTTARSSGAPGPTSPPAPTRTQPTTPPTTAPPTTAPTTSSGTSTSTTTSTTRAKH